MLAPRISSLPIAALALLVVASGARAQPPAVDLLGSWHVLVHFTDSAADDPEAHRWVDRVWKFEMKGRRLLWSEYPIVVFNDMRGRFTMIAGTTRGRVQEYWEPNAGQLRNIRDGLEVNERESKAKTMRGSLQSGYRSSGGLRSASTSVIGYTQSWSVDDPAGLPVFTRDDLLGSARTENMHGRTQYTTTEVRGGGSSLWGRFERDLTAVGSFRMTRMGELRLTEGRDEHDPDAEVEIRLGFAVDRGASAAELAALLDAPDPGAQRERALELILALLREDLKERGQDPLAHYARTDSLAQKILTLMIDEGASLDEVEVMLRRGELLP